MSDAARSEGEPHDLPDNNAAEPDAGKPEPARGGALELIPYIPEPEEEPLRASRDERPFGAQRRTWPAWDWSRIAAAASLTGVVLIGAAAAAAHVHAWRVARAEAAQERVLAHRLDGMTGRLDALESNRSRDDLANLKKVLAEIKASAASTRDVGGAVTQLAQRVEKLEKDQGARLDKLGDRIDKDAAARLAEMTARLDKLEAKVAAAPVAAKPAAAKVEAKAEPVAAKAAPTPPAKPETAKAEPAVSNETTGSIDKPKPRLRGFYVSEIHNGYAMIDGPEGEFAVGPGDVVPGGGRVLRIERHGRDWVVITTQGQIVASD